MKNNISVLVFILNFSFACSSFALPWSTDMWDAPSVKPYEEAREYPDNNIRLEEENRELERTEYEEIGVGPNRGIESIKQGKELYQTYCYACHGMDGGGYGPVIKNDLRKDLKLLNKKILITAGPTYESIDAVRFIGNYSTGKMGFALAKVAAKLGADVTLISGPTSLSMNDDYVKVINVITADQMFSEVKKHYESSEITIMSAAVSDFKPRSSFDKKIKKENKNLLSIELVENVDILKYLGENKNNNQILVGFALETDNEVEHAKLKIQKKNLDAIILNSLNDKGAGFGHDTNKVTYINFSGTIQKFKLKLKDEVAKDIFDQILTDFNEKI